MRDLRFELKIKNNRIYSRIIERWGSITIFCFCTGISYPITIGYINFTLEPTSVPSNRNKKYREEEFGFSWKISAIKLADTLGSSLFDLWPDEYMRKRKRNNFSIVVNREDMMQLSFEERKLLMESNKSTLDISKEDIEKVLKNFPSRWFSLKELSKILGIQISNVSTAVKRLLKDKDVFEVIWTCPRCGEIFLATIYRDTYSKEKGDERGE